MSSDAASHKPGTRGSEDSFLARPSFYDLGWGFLVAWGISIIFTGAFSIGEQSNLGYFWIASMVGAPCGLLFLFLSNFDLVGQKIADLFRLIALTAMIMGTITLIVSLFANPGLAAFLQITGGFVSSLGTAIFTVFWGIRFTSFDMRQIESYAAYSLLVAFGCYALVLFVHQVVGVTIVLLLPLMSAYCLRKGDGKVQKNQRADTEKPLDSAFEQKGFFRLGLGIVAATTVISLFWGLVDHAIIFISHRLFEASMLSGMIVAVLLAVYISWFSRTLNLSALYRWVCPLVIVAFSLANLAGSGFTLVACLLVFAAQAMLNLLTFVYFAELSKRTGAPPVKVFGLGRFFQEIGFLFGALLSIASVFLISNGYLGLEEILLFAAALLVIFVMIAISSQDKLAFSLKQPASFSLSGSSQLSADKLLLSTSEEIARTYKLTKREEEILAYLVKGYSLPYIRNELYIAQSTIDTHVRHIYAKLNIHSRKELINLVYGEGASEG